MANEIIMLMHATTGSGAILASVWLLVELFHAKDSNVQRIKLASVITNIFVWLSYVLGGWYYVYEYSTVDKYIIKGSTDLGFTGSLWKFAHGFFTESKEHFFLLGVVIALYVLILAYRTSFVTDKKSRQLMIVLVAILVIGGLTLEGFGAIMAMGVRLGMVPG